MQINGVDLKFDFFEENMNKRAVEAFKSVSADAEMASEKEMHEQIGILCNSVKNAFDYIFGPGTGEKVCGKENTLNVCIDAFSELIEEKNRLDKFLKVKTERLKAAIGNV